MSRQAKGFTLIEMLLAIAIFSFIGMASYSVLSTVLNADELSKERLQRLNDLQRTFTLIERDLMQVSQRHVRANGDESQANVFLGSRYLFDSEQDGIAFTRVGWRNPQLVLPRSDVQAVAYRLYDSEFQRMYFVYPDNISGSEPRITGLIDRVLELRFEYYDENEWKKTWTQPGVPQAIAIYLDTEDFGLIRRLFLLPSMKKLTDESEDSNNDSEATG